MSFSRVTSLGRGVVSRLSSAMGSSRSSSRKALGLLPASPLAPRAAAARTPAACTFAVSLSPSLRPSALRVLAALPHAHPAAAFFPAAAAAAATPAAARFLSSSSNGTVATGSSSSTAATAAAAGDGLSEAAGVEGEGLETRSFKSEASDPPGGDLQKLKSELRETREALEAANIKVRELQDKLLRALAEQENARIRFTKEVAGAREYAISGFAKALLDVGDSLTSATEQLQQQLGKQQEQIQKTDVKNFLEGVVLTENLFQKTLERFGVLKYNPMGDKFDPVLHEALFEMEGPAEKNGSVAQVVQSGYKIKDRVLRAAKVGVVKGQ